MKHMKRTLSALLAALMVLTMLSVMPITASAENITATPDWGPAADGIFYITCPGDLVAFGANAQANTWYTGKTIKITADLDMSGHTWTQATSFRGVLDGQGHAIKNLTITSSGMFLNTGLSTIKDLAIVGGTVNAQHPAVFARDSLGGQKALFENVYIDMDITLKEGSQYAGVFLGQISSGAATAVTFTNCVSACSINGTATLSGVGGFVGWSNAGSTVNFNDCIFLGDLSGADAPRGVGAFIGGVRIKVNMTRCISAGKGSKSATYGSLFGTANPGAEYAINVKDSYVASAAANAIYSEAADVYHSISIQYGTEEAYTLKSGTVLNEKIAEMNGKIKRLDATLTAKNFATLYPDLVNNWVATDKTMTCDDDLTVAKILPLGVAAYVEESVTATKYLQTKTLENDRYDLRFISTVNTDDLEKFVSVGFDVTVEINGGVADGEIVCDDVVKTQTVYTSIMADGVNCSAEQLGADYLNVLQINGFRNDLTYTITILSFAEMADGTTIYDYNGAMKVTVQGGSLMA